MANLTPERLQEIEDLCPPGMEAFFFGEGRAIYVHSEKACSGEYCVVHNPSNHSMRDFPLHWRGDRKMFERICPQGIGHPDPDHLLYILRTKGVRAMEVESVHGCSGGCKGAYDELDKLVDKLRAKE